MIESYSLECTVSCTKKEMDDYIQVLEDHELYVDQYTNNKYSRIVYTPYNHETRTTVNRALSKLKLGESPRDGINVFKIIEKD